MSSINYLKDRGSWLNYSYLIKQKISDVYNIAYYQNLKNVLFDFQSSFLSPINLDKYIYLKINISVFG